jgi:hypothetical protein
MIVELVMKLFICIIDAELLQTIFFKFFKPVNIQNSDEFCIFGNRLGTWSGLDQVVVQLSNQVVEHREVERLQILETENFKKKKDFVKILQKT